MAYITNSRGEKVLRHRLLEIASHDDTIMVKSVEGKGFPVSRFLFNFFSNFVLPCEADVVLTPLPSENLHLVIQTLSNEGLFKEDPFNDIVMDNDSTHRNKPLDPIGNQSEKEYKKQEQSQPELSLSSTNVDANCKAENLNKGMAESLDINSESTQALQTVDRPSNSEDTTEKLKTGKQDKPTNHEIKRVKKKIGRPFVGTTKGNPKIEWDFMDGEKYIKTITCQICGKLFDHEKYENKKNIVESYRGHYRKHELETTDCGCDNIEFKSDLERNQHWKIVHKGHLFCKLCRKTFPEAGYKLHIEKNHQEKMCDQCNYKNSNSYYLKVHIRNVHGKRKEDRDTLSPFACNQDDCEKTFKSKCQLHAHVNKVHVISTCRYCNKQVKRLDQHIQTMHSEKKYQCDKCTGAFGSMAKLLQHEKVEHQGLRYFCRYHDCKTKEQEYRDSSNRSAHERKRHGAPFPRSYD